MRRNQLHLREQKSAKDPGGNPSAVCGWGDEALEKSAESAEPPPANPWHPRTLTAGAQGHLMHHPEATLPGP